MTIYYAHIGLGAWKAQKKSAQGNYSRLFELTSTGADEGEESEFGHIEADFLAFTITLNQPSGQHVKVFFLGKMT
jgi:catechol-2,3-dioxygenase